MDTGHLLAFAALAFSCAGAVWNLHRLLEQKVDGLAKDLHARISDLRQETAKNYLRADLWEAHFGNMEKRLADIQSDIKALLRQAAE